MFMKEAVEVYHELNGPKSQKPSLSILTDVLRKRYTLKHIIIESSENLGVGTRTAYEIIRQHITAVERDDTQELHSLIRQATELITNRTILSQLENKIGTLN